MAFMTAGMASTASVDAVIKSVSVAASPTQIITVVGFGGMVIFSIAAVRQRLPLVSRSFFHKAVLIRSFLEVVGSFGTVLALTLVPLTLVTTIGQAVPLIVTLGAVLFMGERAGWRDWTALLAGFAGMLLIIRPGFEGFAPAALVAVVAAVGLAGRDLASRAAPADVSTLQLGVWGLAVLGLTGLVLTIISGQPLPPVTPPVVAAFVAIVGFAGGAFYCITSAMRVGDVAVVSPFRYARLIFGVLLGVVIFNETLDTPTIVGGAIIVASGLYVWWQEISQAR